MMEPAKTIIEICGGFKEVARMTGRALSRVHRWTYPKDRGGTGGLVPADVQQVLLIKAQREGKPLTPEHFFPDYPSNQETSHEQSSPDTASNAA